MSDCSLIRFFKMLKKLEILPKLVGCGGHNVSSPGWDKNIHTETIPRGGTPQRQRLEPCKCCGPPRQSRISRGLLFKEKAQATSPWRSASDPETRSLARQAGSESNLAAEAPPSTGRGCPARLGPNGRQRIPRSPRSTRNAPALSSLTIPRRRRGTTRWREGPLPSSRSERCDGCGWRTFVTPPAGGRWAIRGAEILPIAGLPRSEASPIAPATAKWLIGRRSRDRSHRSDEGSVPSGVHGGCREVACHGYSPTVLPNTQIRPGASAPASRRVDSDWIRSGRNPASRALVST
jgi:hypothetical protein